MGNTDKRICTLRITLLSDEGRAWLGNCVGTLAQVTTDLDSLPKAAKAMADEYRRLGYSIDRIIAPADWTHEV